MQQCLFLTSEKTGSTLLVSALLGQNGFFSIGNDAFQNPNKPVWIKTIPKYQCKFYYDIDYNLDWIRNRTNIPTAEAYRTYPSGIIEPEFYDSFPNSSEWKFIYLFRDPRNRTASKAHRYAKAQTEIGKQYNSAFDLVFKSELTTSMYEMRSITKIWKDPRFYLLRSEDLFANPLEEFTAVWNFIGFQLDKEFYSEHFNKQTKNWKVSTFNDDGKDSLCRWKNWEPQYKTLFKEQAGTELIQLGYEKDMDW
jgi:hypothetical protein